MTDALDIAKRRKSEYQAEITKKKAEIVELEEMIGDLESFVEFGQELIGRPAKAAEPKTKPTSQIKEVVATPAEKAKPKDEWAEDSTDSSIARVLSARQG